MTGVERGSAARMGDYHRSDQEMRSLSNVEKYKVEVWDDSQARRDGARRWKVVDDDGASVANADCDYASSHEAELAGRHAKRTIEGHEEPERVDYRQFFRPTDSQGRDSPE
ncbi:hypothetical protein [Nocardioides sp. B-3]|uniref:hypothetical protein n=1 Tax=Nocardioides sp. B-3 TaxID=2895565 RepID=UPI0021523405|nr:hypothetical protein [Nocardioides sp. B-3]UUZ59548.1 hypothetical protein LP418_27940 [Nocardioides sp. B-3]